MTKAEWQTVRTNALAALNGTLERGVNAYTTFEGQSLTSMSVEQLTSLIQRADNAISRLDRGTRFGGIKFTSP